MYAKRQWQEAAFFPTNVIQKLNELGFAKSKKGNIYKMYSDCEEEILVVPKCRRNSEGMRRVDWFIKFAEQQRQLIFDEAADLSDEFAKDAKIVQKLIQPYEY
jgi:hypothetical protein